MNNVTPLRTSAPDDLARPPITVLQSEADALAGLALSPTGRSRLASQLLLEELERARTTKPGKLPGDVVSMNSHVLFVEEASKTRHSVQVVYPKAADIAQGRVSVLSLIGAALIGTRRGQSIDWPDRSGRWRRLHILDVTQAREAETLQ